MLRRFRRWFHREFFADFELGSDGRFRVPVARIPEPPEQMGTPTTIDACASYY